MYVHMYIYRYTCICSQGASGTQASWRSAPDPPPSPQQSYDQSFVESAIKAATNNDNNNNNTDNDTNTRRRRILGSELAAPDPLSPQQSCDQVLYTLLLLLLLYDYYYYY